MALHYQVFSENIYRYDSTSFLYPNRMAAHFFQIIFSYTWKCYLKKTRSHSSWKRKHLLVFVSKRNGYSLFLEILSEKNEEPFFLDKKTRCSNDSYILMKRASEASLFFLGFQREKKPLHNGSTSIGCQK